RWRQDRWEGTVPLWIIHGSLLKAGKACSRQQRNRQAGSQPPIQRDPDVPSATTRVGRGNQFQQLVAVIIQDVRMVGGRPAVWKLRDRITYHPASLVPSDTNQFI